MADTQSKQNRRIQQSELPTYIGAGSKPTHADLFSGIGGFALAAKWAGFRTIAFCEIDKYCQKVLTKNFLADTEELQRNGSEHHARSHNESEGQVSEPGNGYCNPRIHSNIFDFDGTLYQGCSLITGGFPCQPFSVAGKRRGAADDRAIWPEMFRVISEARPAWVLGENVPGIIPMELDNVLSDLEGIGYACRTFVIPACAVNAKHRRDRLWIVARLVTRRSTQEVCTYSNITQGLPVAGISGSGKIYLAGDIGLSNSNKQRLEGQRKITVGIGTQLNNAGDHCRWLPEPDVGRVAHGISSRVDRLKGLGNAIVPQVAYEILKEIRKMIAYPQSEQWTTASYQPKNESI